MNGRVALHLCLLIFSFFSSNISFIFHPFLNVLNNVSGQSTTIVQQAFTGPLFKRLPFPTSQPCFTFLAETKVCISLSLNVFLHGRNCFSHKTKFRWNQKDGLVLNQNRHILVLRQTIKKKRGQ